jgi:hypothetical protein
MYVQSQTCDESFGASLNPTSTDDELWYNNSPLNGDIEQNSILKRK